MRRRWCSGVARSARDDGGERSGGNARWWRRRQVDGDGGSRVGRNGGGEERGIPTRPLVEDFRGETTGNPAGNWVAKRALSENINLVISVSNLVLK